jgi:toxin CcdB
MQGDVHRNFATSADHSPYLLDVQADLLSDLDTRAVVPLVRAALFGRRAGRFHPEFSVNGELVVMATHLIAAIRERELGAALASLRDHRDAMIAAIDILLSGV